MANLAENLRHLKSRVSKGEPVVSVARHERINAMMDCILALARGENISAGLNLRKKSGDGFVILSAEPKGKRGGASTPTPFFASKTTDSSEPPYPVLKLYPGKIANIVPTVDGVPLDQPADDPDQPWIYTQGDVHSVYLKCLIDLLDPAANYRSHISTVEVVLTEDVPTEALDDNGDPLEGVVTWTGENQAEIDRTTQGYFFINVCRVMGSEDGGNIVIGEITQWLFTSYASFAIAGDEAIPIA